MAGAHQSLSYNNQERATIFNINNSLYVQKNQQIAVIRHPHCFVQTLLFLTQWVLPQTVKHHRK
jgi:hypothetical protein